MLPKHTDIMPIVIQVMKTNGQGTYKMFLSATIEHFKISEEEAEERIKSGTQTVLYNRVAWACTYLYQAGLLKRDKRSYSLSEDGIKVANSGVKVDLDLLKSYPSFIAFQTRNSASSNDKEEVSKEKDVDDDTTPDIMIDRYSEQLTKSLSDELLDNILDLSPTFFEHLVVDLLKNMGYAYDENSLIVTKVSNDGGIDGIVSTDKLGFDKICIQAKRYDKEHAVTRKEIRDFLGALDDFGSDKGVFITTSHFNKEASDFYSKSRSGSKVIMIDGKKLCQYMIDYNLGVFTERVISIKRIDKNYFQSED